MASNKGKCQVCPKFSDSRCSWCKLVFYCSKEHQKQDWPHHKESCTKKKYRMEENEQLGRHLVAAEDIKPDHILFKDKPLVLSYKLDTLEYTGNKICVGCYKEIPLVNPKKERRWKGEDDMKSGIKLEALEKILGCSRKQERSSVQSEQSNENDDDDGQKEEKDNDENSSAGSPIISNNDQDGGGGGCGVELEEEDDYDESDEYDNSNDENNDDDELEKNVCLSCRLPICSPACSSHYFHKQLECRLLREAALHNQKQLQQNHENKTFSAAAAAPAMATSLSASSSSSSPAASSSLGESSNSSSLANGNQACVSLATTTCNNTSYSAPASGSTNITPSISNGIREILLRNLLYFRCLLLKHVNEGHWNELMSLQSNDEARKSDVASLEKTAHIFTFIKKALTEINHPTMMREVYKPDIHKLIGIIEINALHVNISPNVEVTGLFPTYSLLEHSCIPSVKFYLVPCAPPPPPLPESVVTEGIVEGDNMKNNGNSKKSSKSSSFLFELYCRSAVKLKSGDHLSVAYTNAMWNTEKRREFLKKEKYFWCECRRCNSADELGSNFSTILCPLQECKAPSVPVSAVKAAVGATGKGGVVVAGSNGSHEFQWKCTSAKCGKACAGWQVKKVDMKLCEMVGKTKPSIESYKECLDRMEELVHPDYYLCCIVTHSLIQMYGHDDGSVHDKKLLEEKIAFCNKLLGVMKKLDPGLAVFNIYASVVFYEMHSAILAMAGAEVDEDYHILRNNPETVNLAKVYLQRCIDCFKYEFLEVPETKLKMLAIKKMEYLNLVMNKR